MFNPFKSRTKDVQPERVAPTEPAEAPKKDGRVYYSVGPTNDGRIGLTVGYGTITMNKAGAESLIKMLQASIDNICREEESDDND
jgi:hypothetical protein